MDESGEVELEQAEDAAPAPRRRRRLWIAIGCVAALLLLVPSFLLWTFPPLRKGPAFLKLLSEPLPIPLPLPVEGVAPSQLTDSWGSPRSGGRSHEGIDIFAPRHTPVRSPVRGIVFKRGTNRLGGRIVTVTGPRGYHHYHAHLESFGEPEAGEWVEAGEVLGTVGDSGNARGTPPHLHYGIYTLTGRAVNPYPLLTASPPPAPPD